MRLLNVDTKELQEFQDDNDLPAYVIASHRWTKEEITMHDWQNQENIEKFGFQKVARFCAFVRDWAAELDLHWLWIDTVCIDKRDPNGIQEAINSMFKYYQQACVCLAFLHDVMPLSCEPTRILQSFEQSVWFKRGWTLQELLAPEMVLFLNQDWEVFGHKASAKPPGILSTRGMNRKALSGHEIKLPLNHVISSITGIQKAVLDDYAESKKLDIETKKEWMKERTTSKAEDRAYALLGICDVYLPLIYGEGRNAMNRLEDAIKAAHGSQKRSEMDLAFGEISDPFAHLGVGPLSQPYDGLPPPPILTPLKPPPPPPPPPPFSLLQSPTKPGWRCDQLGAYIDTFLQSVKSCEFVKYDFTFESIHQELGSTLVTRQYDRKYDQTVPSSAHSVPGEHGTFYDKPLPPYRHVPIHDRSSAVENMQKLRYLPRKKIMGARQSHCRSPEPHKPYDEYLSSSLAVSEADANVDDTSARANRAETSRHARRKPMLIESQRLPKQNTKPFRHSRPSANKEHRQRSSPKPLTAHQPYIEDYSEDSSQEIQLTPEASTLQESYCHQGDDLKLSTKEKFKKTILKDILEKDRHVTENGISGLNNRSLASHQQEDPIFIPRSGHCMRQS